MVAALWRLVVVLPGLLLWQGTGVAVVVDVVGAAAAAWTPTGLSHSSPSGSFYSSLSLSLPISSNDGDGKQLLGGATAGGKRAKSSRPNKDSTNNKKGPGPRRGDRRPRQSPASSSSLSSSSSASSLWRVYGVEVHPDALLQAVEDEDEIVRRSQRIHRIGKIPPADYLHPAILQSLYRRLGIDAMTIYPSSPSENNTNNTASSHNTQKRLSDSSSSPLLESVRIVRRSLDARHRSRRADGGTGPRYVYVLDVRLAPTSSTGRRNLTPLLLRHQPGRLERQEAQEQDGEEDAERTVEAENDNRPPRSNPTEDAATPSKTVLVVGAGPAGLLAALSLVKFGQHNITPIVLERGQPVESRGRDIGALAHRRILNTNSNYAYGEGGAGTWSDGKLTTRIGRNSGPVRTVLQTLVDYGAPSNILVEGAPHLGTDNLVRLLRNLRNDLVRLGGTIHFGHQVTRFLVKDGTAIGVEYTAAGGKKGTLYADAVIVAAGHSARDVYELLQTAGAQLEPKGFAVGYRVEHPQALINRLQYGTTWGSRVETGRAGTDAANQRYFRTFGVGVEQPGAVYDNAREGVDHHDMEDSPQHPGRLAVPSYRLAADLVSDGTRHRSVYSFCMCPGGQVVPSSTEPGELCVNGMSFSRRDSQWANSALVVTVDADDELLDPYRTEHGALAGMAFQRDMERRASALGGGNLTVPVQRLTDFLAAKPSTSAPPSSYRLGVVPAACHEIYPPPIVEALRNALVQFDRTLPGYVCEDGLLHAVETRTSSPIRVGRDPVTLQAVGLRNLFPAGEGAGFAGGIVSAAVDGIAVAEGVLDAVLLPSERARKSASGRATSKGVDTYY